MNLSICKNCNKYLSAFQSDYLKNTSKRRGLLFCRDTKNEEWFNEKSIVICELYEQQIKILFKNKKCRNIKIHKDIKQNKEILKIIKVNRLCPFYFEHMMHDINEG